MSAAHVWSFEKVTVMTKRACLALIVTLVGASSAAQESRREAFPVQPPDAAQKRDQPTAATALEQAPAEPVDPQPLALEGQLTPVRNLPSKEHGRLAGAALLELQAAAARVRLTDGGLVELRAGAPVDGDVVLSVRGRQVLLRRAAQAGQPGGEGLVILDFLPGGKARVRVLWTDNPAVAPAMPGAGQ
jgi:hypothetical protein